MGLFQFLPGLSTKPPTFFPGAPTTARAQYSASSRPPPLHRLSHNPTEVETTHAVRHLLSHMRHLPISELKNKSVQEIYEKAVSPTVPLKIIHHSPLKPSSAQTKAEHTSWAYSRRKTSIERSQVSSNHSYEEMLKSYDRRKEIPRHEAAEVSPILSHSVTDPQALIDSHFDYRAADAVTSRRIQKAIRGAKPPEEKIRNLQMLLCSSERIMNKSNLSQIYNHLWNLGGYDQMIEMMDNALHQGFKSDSVNLEFYARALIKSSYFNPSNVISLAHIMLNQTDPETSHHEQWYALIGRIHSMKQQAARDMIAMLDAGENSQQVKETYALFFPEDQGQLDRNMAVTHHTLALANATIHFQKAFDQTYDPRYGVRLVHCLLEMGDKTEAIRMAEFVQLASLRDGVQQSNNPSLIRAYIESAYAIGKTNDHLLHMENLLLASCTQPSQCKSAITSISHLSETLHDPAIRLRIGTLCQSLEKQAQDLSNQETAPLVIKELKAKALASSPNRSETTLEWEHAFYDLQGKTSNYINGNFSFGGQLPAQNINRHDRQFFKEILSTSLSELLPEQASQFAPVHSLEEIQDPTTFLQALDLIIRKNYRIDEWHLERLDSEGHKIFDGAMKGLIHLSGVTTPCFKKTLPDSRTNISATFLIGLGDCRHAALSKQILFDLWKENQINILLDELTDASINPASNDQEAILNQIQLLLTTKLKTIDCQLIGPVAKKQDEEFQVPEWKGTQLVLAKDEADTVIEEHTFNVLCRYDSNDNLESVQLADAFYQNTYPLGSGEISIQGQNFSKKGPGIQVASIPLYNSNTNTTEERGLRIRPTLYAGPRDLYDRGSQTNKFIGLTIPNYSHEEYRLHKDKYQEYVQRVSQWFKNLEP